MAYELKRFLLLPQIQTQRYKINDVTYLGIYVHNI